MLRAATCGRFSSSHQPEHSTVDQRELAIAYAERHGMTIVAHFSDDAKTGRRARNREGFQALCDAVREKQIDLVIIEVADRIARSVRIGAGFYDLIQHHGIAAHSLTGPVNSLVFKMSLVVPEQQSLDNGFRTRQRQIQRLKATGRVVAGMAYGYEKVEGDGINRRIAEAEAEVVRRIYREYANGLSPNEIARRLNADGIPGPRGMPWSNTTIRGDRARMTGIVRNPIYVGRILYGRTQFSIERTPGSRARPSLPTTS
jgi:site-specific DNA recombinase